MNNTSPEMHTVNSVSLKKPQGFLTRLFTSKEPGKYSILGTTLHDLSFEGALSALIELAKRREHAYVTLSNVHMVVECILHKRFHKTVMGATLRLADGMPLCKATQLIYGRKLERVCGMDLLPALLVEAEKHGLSIFFLGSQEHIMKRFFERLNIEHPNLKVAGYDTGMVSCDLEKNAELIARINASGADFICVCLGCPKQEVWMELCSPHITGVMLGLGAAFAVYARAIPRAPLWMQKASLEWLHRLANDPGRLWQRYFVTNSIFLGLIFIQFLCHHIRSAFQKP